MSSPTEMRGTVTIFISLLQNQVVINLSQNSVSFSTKSKFNKIHNSIKWSVLNSVFINNFKLHAIIIIIETAFP